MPTSVGPNTKGEENLVFGYDTGDSANSYKGEPTINLNNSSDRAQGISVPVGNRNFAGITVTETANYFYSTERPHVLRLVCTVTGSNGYKEFAQQSSGNTSGSTYIYSFDYKFIKPNNNDTGTMGTPFVYGNGYKNPDSGTRQANVSQTNYPLKDGWTRRAFKYDATYTGNNYYRTNTHSNDRYFEVLLDNFQIQESDHFTPFTPTERSVSGSLLDLTNNSTIDLSNVSFDSNAQMEFDGSSDYINFPAGTMPNFGTDDFAIEVVFKMTKSTSYSHFYQVKDQYYFALKMSNGDQRIYVYRTSALSTYSSIPADTTLGAWHHLVCQRNGDNIEMYLNGEYKGSKSGWGSIDIDGDTYDTIIGKYNNEYSQGKQAITKVYNRALTASEVKANFNAVKSRFGI